MSGELELNSQILVVKHDGHKYELNYPKVKQQQGFAKAQKEKGEDEALLDLLADCGLPKDVAVNMEMWMLNKIVLAFYEKKS
tara:strand:+ start:705 stop:950 length:246 start_codon:yes stop_codon:yes gene_type:complete